MKKIKVLNIHMLRTSICTYQGVQYQFIIWCTPSFRLVHWKHKYSTIWFMTWSLMKLAFQNGFKVYFFQTPAGYVYQVIYNNVRIFNWFTLSLILDFYFFKRWLSLDIPGPLTFFGKLISWSMPLNLNFLYQNFNGLFNLNNNSVYGVKSRAKISFFFLQSLTWFLIDRSSNLLYARYMI